MYCHSKELHEGVRKIITFSRKGYKNTNASLIYLNINYFLKVIAFYQNRYKSKCKLNAFNIKLFEKWLRLYIYQKCKTAFIFIDWKGKFSISDFKKIWPFSRKHFESLFSASMFLVALQLRHVTRFFRKVKLFPSRMLVA